MKSDQVSQVVPSGTLKYLKTEQVSPSRNNPRMLFDPEPLRVLRENIRQHGVLVPITVYKLKGQDRYQILDGERRYRSCVLLEEEGVTGLSIPANIVEPPNSIAGLLYMFSIHNFREAWELMPVALSLKVVIKELGEDDTVKLSKLTGLSEPQVERCKLLLNYPERFQKLSLEPDPEKRIPANLWIEAEPLFEIIEEWLPPLFKKQGRDGISDIWVSKYQAGAIKSVIHFRRIVEAAEQAKEHHREDDFKERLGTYLTDASAETRATFDTFVAEAKKIGTAMTACEDFIKQIRRAKIEHIVERDVVIKSLKEVQQFIGALLSKLEGEDPPKGGSKGKH
jgi:ParB family chromosome partitioning protein